MTIPPALKAGDCLLRAEAIALHAVSQPGGAQFYVTCYVSLLHWIPFCFVLVFVCVWLAGSDGVCGCTLFPCEVCN